MIVWPPLGRRLSALWPCIGPRGLALLFFAVLDVVYGWSFLTIEPDALSPGLRWVDSIVPLEVWGGAWIVVGAVLLFGVFIREDSIPWALAMLIKVAWGVVWLAGAITGVDRAYAQAAIWLPAAGLVAVLATWLPHTGGKGTAWTRAPKSP